MSKKSDEVQPIIIKKIKKGGGGHHGGAWKVAYADFVTAMMAFFLLLWLLNVSTKEELKAISNYFDPSHPTVSRSESGAGGILGGLTIATEGAQSSTIQQLTQEQTTGKAQSGQSYEETDSAHYQEMREIQQMEDALRASEDDEFERVKEQIERALKSREFADLAGNMLVEIDTDGLRIELLDQDGKPMFPSGSAEMYENTRKLMTKVADLIKKLPNNISIRGHTDSIPYGQGARYTNWELSADRANATRRVLMAAKVPEARLADVMGKADTELFIPEKPNDARNRRISILLLREPLAKAIERGEFGDIEVPRLLREGAAERRGARGTMRDDYLPPLIGDPNVDYRKTRGDVYFP